MNRARMQSKFLAALLAILMVLSVVVALPTAAEETAAPVSAEKVLYSLDMSKAGALDATATAEWLAKNNGFATTATNTNTIDADGFYKIAKSGVVMSNGAPNDFFNLLAGWYPGYNTPGKTYEITMDLRLDKEVAYTRTTSSPIKDKETGETVGYNYYYEDAAGNKYSSIHTDESGWSFFAARLGDTYNSLFRIGMVDGKTYLFAESSALSVNSTNIKEVGNVYVKDADGKKLYVSDIGGQVTGNTGSFGLSYIIVPEKSYEIENGGVYSLRVVYELTKRTGTKTSVKAHLYVKGANDAEETYLGNTTWASNTTLAANDFHISDAGNIASIANIKVTVDEPSTVVWSADLSKFGPNANGNMARDEMVSHLANTLAIKGQTASLTTLANNAQVIGGFVNAGGNSTSLAATDARNPFIDLLTGNFVHKGEKLTSTFIEFDYKLGTETGSEFTASGRSDAATVGGTSYTIVNDHAVSGGASYNLRFRSGDGKNNTTGQLFRISANGYLYTGDLEYTANTTATGVDGYLYYMDGEDKVFFDADGYRYKLNGNEKSYIDDTSKAAPAVSGLEIIGSVNPAKLDQAYKLTKGTTYRIGVKNVVESVSAGISTIKQTVYIKAPGDTEWTLVGTSTQKWYDSTTSGYDANYAVIWAAGCSGMMFGGNMVAYACVDGQHVEGYATTETVLSDTGLLIERTSCSLCGRDEAKRNGVLYTSQNVTSTCETSYTLWTAADGSGKTFITDVTEGSHNYATANGLCSKCNTYAYMPDIARRGTTSLNIAKGLDNAPAYDSTTQTIKAPNGGMALCYPANKLNPRSPFIMTLEFKLTEAIVNDASKKAPWPLLSYQVGTDGASGSTIIEYVNVYEVDGKPTLNLGADVDRPIKTIEYDTWYTLQVAVVPTSDAAASSSYSDARIYLDGEMIGEKYNFAFRAGNLINGNVRVGIQTAGSKYRFAWEARYVDFQQTTLEGAYTLQNSNEVINIRYDRFQTEGPSHDSAKANIGTTLPTFRPTEIVGGKYGILGNTNDKNVSLSTLLADGTEFGLSGKKYEIKLKFAVPNTDDDGDGKPDAISGSMNLVRLSKYNEAIQSTLVSCRSATYTTPGQIHAGSKDLYDVSNRPITVLREFDENGVPTGILDLRVVVDEANNVYSIYVGDDIAYYLDGDNLVPFMNMPMPLNQNGGTGKTTYGSITKADAVAANITGTYQYVRFFREIATVALEEISVKLIPDSNVELVGTQVKTADKTTSGGFDLRFVFGLDDLYKENVQFDVKAYKNGQYVGSQSSEPVTKVFSSIKTGDNTKLYAYECTEGDYLTAVKVVGIDETTASDIYTFEITAYLVDVNGNRISPRTYIVSCNGLGGNIRTVGK